MVPSPDGDERTRTGADGAVAAPQSAVVQSEVSVGRQLKDARLAKNLSANDVARALKLSLRQVEAIEADDWQSPPCNTIIRGFVRNYARLLGVDAHQLMSELDRVTLPPTAELQVSAGTPVSMPSEGRVDRRDFARVVAGLVVLLLAVGAYFFVPQDLWQSAVSALKSATQAAAVKPVRDEAGAAVEPSAEKADTTTAPAAPVTPTVPAAPAASSVPAVSAPSAGTASAVASPAPAAIAPSPAAASPSPVPTTDATQAPGAEVLHFSFAQPSWVEVRDRSGKVIFSKKNDAGSQRDVEGQPPFAVVIGNTGYVTLQYKGKSVDLSKRSKEDVARLSVE